MSRPIDFWFSIGSTLYVSDGHADRGGGAAEWRRVSVRPFDVRAIMVEMNNIPFSTKPIKAQYMWRDVERRAAMYGIAWSAIPPYPLRDLIR
jgi:2-hydroxychromene-2-carboxylate isomerase